MKIIIESPSAIDCLPCITSSRYAIAPSEIKFTDKYQFVTCNLAISYRRALDKVDTAIKAGKKEEAEFAAEAAARESVGGFEHVEAVLLPVCMQNIMGFQISAEVIDCRAAARMRFELELLKHGVPLVSPNFFTGAEKNAWVLNIDPVCYAMTVAMNCRNASTRADLWKKAYTVVYAQDDWMHYGQILFQFIKDDSEVWAIFEKDDQEFLSALHSMIFDKNAPALEWMEKTSKLFASRKK